MKDRNSPIDIFMLFIEVLMVVNNGCVFRLNTDLIIDKLEKTRDAKGIDGRHAILPRLSSMQEKESDWSTGMVRIPLNISHMRMMTWIGDSTTLVMDLISCA